VGKSNSAPPGLVLLPEIKQFTLRGIKRRRIKERS
jgi:hypothetical protein